MDNNKLDSGTMSIPTDSDNNGPNKYEETPPPIVKEPISVMDVPHHEMDRNNYEKKPSYLNLACCVNGYSNLTTYDSKVRQSINKSREVSPIRPSSNSIPYCKKSDAFMPPKLFNTLDVVDKSAVSVINNIERNNNSNSIHSTNNGSENTKTISFIQQRVERLYGPGALAQGFYSPKKSKGNSQRGDLDETQKPVKEISELSEKFKSLKPNKANIESSISDMRSKYPSETQKIDSNVRIENVNVDLPVMRHLSEEFRAQLPVISPKKHTLRLTTSTTNETKAVPDLSTSDNHNPVSLDSKPSNQETLNGHEAHISIEHCTPGQKLKDGTYFLNILKDEQKRLLVLAEEAEKYIEFLLSNPDANEEVLGILRSASGKARLLVTQKLKQFEGLCNKNMNSSIEDEFPTTVDDLQGFWDMVYLQVDHINVLFSEIEEIKQNGWKVCNKPQADPVKTPSKGNAKKNRGSETGTVLTKPPKSESTLKRESQRKQFLELKRKQKMEMSSKINENEVDTTNYININNSTDITQITD